MERGELIDGAEAMDDSGGSRTSPVAGREIPLGPDPGGRGDLLEIRRSVRGRFGCAEDQQVRERFLAPFDGPGEIGQLVRRRSTQWLRSRGSGGSRAIALAKSPQP